MSAPNLIISIDFELYWGVRDAIRLCNYQENLLGVRSTVPATLKLFRHYNIHATWAIVGMLLNNSLEQLVSISPRKRPNYFDKNLCPYIYIETSGDIDPIFHLAENLFDLIKSTPHQEIATHTYSHFYCAEPPYDVDAFSADLELVQKQAQQLSFELSTIVFPRNQYTNAHIQRLPNHGINCYRSLEAGWAFSHPYDSKSRWIRKAIRLIDSYFNILGHHPSTTRTQDDGRIISVSSSRFFRPYNRRLAVLEPLKIDRIKRSMTYCAQEGLNYHLWWHPHNHGANKSTNLNQLESILDHFCNLNTKYGMKSSSLRDISLQYRNGEAHEHP